MTPPTSERELIDRLTGVRSGKPNFYRQYRRTAAGLDQSIRALEAATRAMSDVPAGPAQLVCDFAAAVVRVFDAPWVALVVDHPSLGSTPLVTMAGPHGPAARAEAPGRLASVLGRSVGAGVAGGELRLLARRPPEGALLSAPLHWSDGCGWLAVGLDEEASADAVDDALLGTLAHQVEVSVRSAQLLAETERMQAETARIRQELAAMRAQEVLERQREHLARDLHDTVIQQVLGIGMKVEWCRSRVDAGEVADALLETRDLARSTIDRIRSAIAELTAEPPMAMERGLAARLVDATDEFVHRGPTVVADLPAALPVVPEATARALEMMLREALANALVHACACVVTVTASSGGGELVLAIVDDGQGRPERLRAHLHQALACRGTGYGRGLANAFLRIREAGGALVIDDAGPGVAIRATVPVIDDLP